MPPYVNHHFKELQGLEACVDDVVFMPGADAPPERPFPFVYYITIRNRSPRTVTVIGRKWVVSQKNGEVIVVEGDGVVGQFPRLEPGGEFPYNSSHTVSHDSRAEGAYFARDEDGTCYVIPIPPFDLDLPTWV